MTYRKFLHVGAARCVKRDMDMLVTFRLSSLRFRREEVRPNFNQRGEHQRFPI